MKNLLYSLCALFLFFSCTDDNLDRTVDRPDEDLRGPLISAISHPDLGQVFHYGEKIDFEVMFFDYSGLKEYTQVILHENDSLSDCNPANCVAVIKYLKDELEGYFQYECNTHIIVGAAQDNYPTFGNGKRIEWKSGNYFVVSKGVDLLNNVNYSAKYYFSIDL